MAVIALLLSLWIYRDYRSPDTIINAVFSNLGYGQFFNFRELALPEWVIYNLPEALWVFAVTLWSYDRHIHLRQSKIPLQYFPLLYPIVLEFLQLWHLTDGRFDVWDILLALLGWSVAMWICSRQEMERSQRIPVHFAFFLYIIVFLSDVI